MPPNVWRILLLISRTIKKRTPHTQQLKSLHILGQVVPAKTIMLYNKFCETGVSNAQSYWNMLIENLYGIMFGIKIFLLVTYHQTIPIGGGKSKCEGYKPHCPQTVKNSRRVLRSIIEADSQRRAIWVKSRPDVKEYVLIVIMESDASYFHSSALTNWDSVPIENNKRQLLEWPIELPLKKVTNIQLKDIFSGQFSEYPSTSLPESQLISKLSSPKHTLAQ